MVGWMLENENVTKTTDEKHTDTNGVLKRIWIRRSLYLYLSFAFSIPFFRQFSSLSLLLLPCSDGHTYGKDSHKQEPKRKMYTQTERK